MQRSTHKNPFTQEWGKIWGFCIDLFIFVIFIIDFNDILKQSLCFYRQ